MHLHTAHFSQIANSHLLVGDGTGQTIILRLYRKQVTCKQSCERASHNRVQPIAIAGMFFISGPADFLPIAVQLVSVFSRNRLISHQSTKLKTNGSLLLCCTSNVDDLTWSEVLRSWGARKAASELSAWRLGRFMRPCLNRLPEQSVAGQPLQVSKQISRNVSIALTFCRRCKRLSG